MDEQDKSTIVPEPELEVAVEGEAEPPRELTPAEKDEHAERLEREKLAQAEASKPDEERGITREKQPHVVVHGNRRTDVEQVVTRVATVPGGVIVSTPHVPKPMPSVVVGHPVHTRNPALPHPDLRS